MRYLHIKLERKTSYLSLFLSFATVLVNFVGNYPVQEMFSFLSRNYQYGRTYPLNEKKQTNTYTVILFSNYTPWKLLVDVSTRIGFTATVSSSSSSWSSGTLVFPVVITNLGNGYDPNNGVFTAPTAGTYVFFVNIISYSTKTVSVKIILNGGSKVVSLAESGSSNPNNSGSNLAVLTLQKADRVWVSYNYGIGYYGGHPTTSFSGFLIWFITTAVTWI